MHVDTRERQTFYAVTAQQLEQPSTRESERRLAARLAVALGMLFTAGLITIILVPGLRSLVGIYVAYSGALIAALFAQFMRDRSHRLSSRSPESEIQTPPADAASEAERATLQRRRAA